MDKDKLDFNNHEIGFQHLSDSDLRKAKILFSLVGYPWLLKFGKLFLPLSLKFGFPVKQFLRYLVVRHFCGGESLGEAQKKTRELATYQVKVCLDYAVESSRSESEILHVIDEIKDSVHLAAKDSDIAFCVFKGSALCSARLLMHSQRERHTEFQTEWKKFLLRAEMICSLAEEKKVRVFIDAEHSWTQDALDEMSWLMIEKFNKKQSIVYFTAQMYRKDRLSYLQNLIDKARRQKVLLGIKLVRGAYLEIEEKRAKLNGYQSPVFSLKQDTDAAFNSAIALIVKNLDIVRLCLATHNQTSTQILVNILAREGISSRDDRVTFSQLYGMSDNLTFNLAKHGFQVSKYLPYGPIAQMMPYLLRRAEENSSVAGQSNREIDKIISEIERRKS